MPGTPSFSWFDEPIKSSINSVFNGLKTGVESIDLLKKYKSAHFGVLKEMVGKIKVLGMSTAIPLADLYYPTTVSTAIRRRLYASEWHSIQEVENSRDPEKSKNKNIDGAVFVENSNRLVVLGGPGAGKTTFLKFLALAYSDKGIFEDTKLKTSKLPCFVSLPELARSDLDLLEHIARPIVHREGEYARAFIERSAKKGLCAILLDSLDEVPENLRKNLVEKIDFFCRTYPDNKVIISCRAADYKEVLPNFDEVEIVKLAKNAVEKIIRSWFKSERSKGDKLISAIKSDNSLSELTETPLLLSLLCIQFKHDLALPRRKVEVYKRCVETLLRDWDTTRGFRRASSYEAVSDMHKERLFEHLAGGATRTNLHYIFSDETVHGLAGEYLERIGVDPSLAKDVVSEIERHHGILERHSAESFCFSHASIQDYFIAKHAIDCRHDYELVKIHLENDSWSSVIEFICALHNDPVEIFKLMTKKASIKNLQNYPAIERRAKLLYLMYRCLSVGPTMRVDARNSANKHIVDSLQNFVRTMASTGVYPMCTISAVGVRHPYYYDKSQRPSLHNALLPYRKLTNEILNRPAPGFSEIAFNICDDVANKSSLTITDLAVILNITAPLSLSSPHKSILILEKTIKNLGNDAKWFERVISPSINYIQSQLDK